MKHLGFTEGWKDGHGGGRGERDWVRVPDLPLTCSVLLYRWLDLSQPQFLVCKMQRGVWRAAEADVCPKA